MNAKGRWLLSLIIASLYLLELDGFIALDPFSILALSILYLLLIHFRPWMKSRRYPKSLIINYKAYYVSRTYLRSILTYVHSLVLDTGYRFADLYWSWGTVWQSTLFPTMWLFSDLQVLNAQRAGYKAAIVHNVDSDDLISMGSNDSKYRYHFSSLLFDRSFETKT